MKISLAQFFSRPGKTDLNLEKHLSWITDATAKGCELIAFPEMSLTGYLTERAGAYALAPADFTKPPFDQLHKAANLYKIAIMVGAPIKYGDGVRISLIYFEPGQTPVFYDKQYLHQDEKPFFEPGSQQAYFSISGKAIVPAICYESFMEAHIQKAWEQKPFDLYLSSVAKPASSLKKAHQNLSEKARNYGIPIAFVNAVGTTDDFINAGKSATWDKQGNLVAELDDQRESLFVIDV